MDFSPKTWSEHVHQLVASPKPRWVRQNALIFQKPNFFHSYDFIAIGSNLEIKEVVSSQLDILGCKDFRFENLDAYREWLMLRDDFINVFGEFLRSSITSNSSMYFFRVSPDYPLVPYPGRRQSIRLVGKERPEPVEPIRHVQRGSATLVLPSTGRELTIPLRCLGSNQGRNETQFLSVICKRAIASQSTWDVPWHSAMLQHIIQISPKGVNDAVCDGDYSGGGVDPQLQPLHNNSLGDFYAPFVLRAGILRPISKRGHKAQPDYSWCRLEELCISISRTCGWASRIQAMTMDFDDYVGLYPVMEEALADFWNREHTF